MKCNEFHCWRRKLPKRLIWFYFHLFFIDYISILDCTGFLYTWCDSVEWSSRKIRVFCRSSFIFSLPTWYQCKCLKFEPYLYHSPPISIAYSPCWATLIKRKFELTRKESVRILIKGLNQLFPINLSFWGKWWFSIHDNISWHHFKLAFDNIN